MVVDSEHCICGHRMYIDVWCNSCSHSWELEVDTEDFRRL